MVPRGGIEPPTQGFSVLCSTNNEETVGVSINGTSTREVTMGEAKGNPLSIGLKMFLKNEISERGVIAPESKHIDQKKLLLEIYKSLGFTDAKIKIDKSWRR